jgi:hypothetical protein
LAKDAASPFIAWQEPQNATDPEKDIMPAPMAQTTKPIANPPARQPRVCLVKNAFQSTAAPLLSTLAPLYHYSEYFEVATATSLKKIAKKS